MRFFGVVDDPDDAAKTHKNGQRGKEVANKQDTITDKMHVLFWNSISMNRTEQYVKFNNCSRHQM